MADIEELNRKFEFIWKTINRLQDEELKTIKYFENRINKLERSSNIQGILSSLGIFFAFLLIGHLAKWI